MPTPGPYPVNTTFLLATRAVASDGRGSVTSGGTTLHPVISEAGAWAFGFATGITITGAALSELQGAPAANSDGSYVNAAGANRVLSLTSAGACEPSNGPPPAP